VDGFRKLGHIQHAKFLADPDANLRDSFADGRHRLPVAWFESLLHAVPFEPARNRASAEKYFRSSRDEPRQTGGLSPAGEDMHDGGEDLVAGRGAGGSR